MQPFKKEHKPVPGVVLGKKPVLVQIAPGIAVSVFQILRKLVTVGISKMLKLVIVGKNVEILTGAQPKIPVLVIKIAYPLPRIQDIIIIQITRPTQLVQKPVKLLPISFYQ